MSFVAALNAHEPFAYRVSTVAATLGYNGTDGTCRYANHLDLSLQDVEFSIFP